MVIKVGELLMKIYNNATILMKLIMGFFVITLIGSSMGVFGMYNISRLSDSDKQIYEVNTLAINYSSGAGTYFQRAHYLILEMISQGADDNRYANIVKIKETINKINDLLDRYGKTINKEERQNAIYKQLLINVAAFEHYCTKIYEAVESGDMKHAKIIFQVYANTTINSVKSLLEFLVNYNTQKAEAASLRNQDLNHQTNYYMWWMLMFSFVISITLGILIARSISKPIRILVQSANKIAMGDINVKIDLDRKDEIGELYQSFGEMIINISNQAYTAEKIADGDLSVGVKVHSEDDLLGKKLCEMVQKNNELLSKIAVTSVQVAIGAEQVSSASIALSQGAMDQSHTIMKLSSAIDQICGQSKLNAGHANKISDLINYIHVKVLEESEQLKDIFVEMKVFSEKANDILKITKGIDDIVFQTNMLSLNASVVTTGSGEYVKGFVDVAEGIRKEAAQLTKASKETMQFFEVAIKRSEEKMMKIQYLIEELKNVLQGIEKINTLVREIELTSVGQEQELSYMKKSILKLSMVVQTNETTSEESASASEELSIQANILKDAVSKYKLNKTDTAEVNLERISPKVWDLLEKMQREKKRYFFMRDHRFDEIAATRLDVENEKNES